MRAVSVVTSRNGVARVMLVCFGLLNVQMHDTQTTPKKQKHENPVIDVGKMDNFIPNDQVMAFVTAFWRHVGNISNQGQDSISHLECTSKVEICRKSTNSLNMRVQCIIPTHCLITNYPVIFQYQIMHFSFNET